jgi:hypothetical protein
MENRLSTIYGLVDDLQNELHLLEKEIIFIKTIETTGSVAGDTNISAGGSSLSDASGDTLGEGSAAGGGTSIYTPPPVVGDKPADIFKYNFGTSNILNFYGWWNGGSRYARYQHHVVFDTPTKKITVQCQDLYAGGGALKVLQGTEYTITCDGVPLITVPVAPGTSKFTVEVSTENITPGYHILDISAFGTESSAAYPIYKPGGELPKWIPTVSGSYEFGFSKADDYKIMWVPAKFDPTIVPLPTGRTYTHFSTPVSRTLLNLEAIVVKRGGNDVRRPTIGKTGELTTQNKQWYTTWDMFRKIPNLPLVDGPRGKGALGYLTHAEVGTAAPVETGPINNVYGCTPWSIVKIRENGEVRTLSGYRNKHPEGLNVYWEDVDNPESAKYRELVGDWSAVPVERRGYWELWGMAWNTDSMKIDEDAPRIPTERNLHPHYALDPAKPGSGGIELVVTDSQNNRVILNKFSPISHFEPPVVTELITGLQDPWDIVEWDDSYIISERKANRIVRYSKQGVYQETIVEGAMDLAKVNPSRLISRVGTMEQIRAQPVCLPEGIYRIRDKQDDWLYYSSAAMGQVRRINMVTREIEIVQSNGPDSTGKYDGPSTFNKIAVSDGTFGPRGTVFKTTWSVTAGGFPYAYLPDAIVKWDPAITQPTVKATTWALSTYSSPVLPRGPGGNWSGWGYAGAVGVGNGRLVGGGACEGVYEITLATGIKDSASKYDAGAKQWESKGYNYSHGAGGYGYYGLPLPWGETPEIDYYLQCHRHVKPL